MAEPSQTTAGPTPMQAIGGRVRQARESAGLTQEQLAEQLGVKQALVSKIELGHKKRADGVILKKIATATGVSLAFLMGDAAEAPETRSTHKPMSERRPTMPAGLEGFLDRHPQPKRLKWYLENTGFKLEPWVEPDDRFWLAQVEFWEKYLADVDAEGGTEGAKPPRKSRH